MILRTIPFIVSDNSVMQSMRVYLNVFLYVVCYGVQNLQRRRFF